MKFTLILSVFKSLSLEHVERSLYALSKQTVKPDEYLLFDNNSGFSEEQVKTEVSKYFNVNDWVFFFAKHNGERKGISWGNNRAIRTATHETFIFCRADYIVTFDFCERLLDVYSSNPMRYVTAWMFGMAASDLEQYGWRENPKALLANNVGCRPELASHQDGPTFCTSKRAMEAAGWYDESLHGWGLDQQDIQTQMMRNGVQMRVIEDFLYFHMHHEVGDDRRDLGAAMRVWRVSPRRIKELARGPLLVYIYVPRDEQHARYAETFLSTYRKFSPLAEHSTVVVCQGGAPDDAMMETFCATLPNCSFYVRRGPGQDIGAYLDVARHLVKNHILVDFMLCCGGSTHFQREGWMRRIVESWRVHGPGVYGSNATYEVSPHLITNGFWCEPSLLAQYPFEVNSRRSRYNFEHGPNAFWKLALKDGAKARLVTWRGDWDWKTWRNPPNIYRRGDQSDILVRWHHNDSFDVSTQAAKLHLRRSADRLTDPLWKAKNCRVLTSAERESLTQRSRAWFNFAHGFDDDFQPEPHRWFELD